MSAPRDAVVVGAGPAGAWTARLLCRAGRDVVLVDRARFPRDKVCGGCVNARARALLRDGGLDGDLGGRPLHGFALHHAGRRAAVALPPGGVAVARRTFDATLLDAARADGVEVRTGVRAAVGGPEDGARAVALDDGTVLRARIVVLATGLGGATPPDIAVRVARRARIGAGRVVAARPAAVPPGTIAMAVARGGYAGVVRLGDGRVDVAAALDPAAVRRAGGIAAAVARVLADAGLPIDLPDDGWRATPPLTRAPERVAAERLFLVGDAAGYVEPFTGEGIGWALDGARALAPVAAAEWTPASARAWARRHAARIRRRQRTCRVLATGLRVPPLVGLARALLASAPALARPVVRAAAAEARA